MGLIFDPFTKEGPEEWLLTDIKLWYAHVGLWFQAVEERYGLDVATNLDRAVWEKYAPLEAGRIRAKLGLPELAGTIGLAQALRCRMGFHLNEEGVEVISDERLRLVTKSCRVQLARQRKGLPQLSCREIAFAEFDAFARAIDLRIRVRCCYSPPETQGEYWCEWDFVLRGAG
ncbi:MAG: hypothetical protein D9V47_15005 [Clostridia bacterium]|nr:MAG: hypothetical protein D9V47_15005 [Clostridia bacterium]